MNELTERYYKQAPRGFDNVWPFPEHAPRDRLLRQILLEETQTKPDEVRRIARDVMNITLS